MREQSVESDVVVVGGGLAGVCAAVAAARLGARVALVNNRPVLGGNSSSEVRVWVCGATAHGNQRWARESGVVGEMYVENQYRNPEGNPVYWDDVVLDTVRREPNITLFLNTDVRHVVASGPDDARRIEEVVGWTMGSELLTTFRAPVFLDCTGDGLVGHLAGARYRLGKEGRAEFGEDWAPDEPVREFLGSTLLFYTKDLGRPVKYVAPESAIDITTTPIPMTRVIRSGDSGAHYWWVEWGGELDIVDDNERIRDELRGVILGIWDHIKNSGQFDAETLTLEWIGNVPGKREYRRFIGDYTLTQQDVIGQTRFPDTVAFGGWSVDLHPAQGMYAQSPGAVQRFSDGVFEIPYRSLYSVNVENMLMAGRDFSATHIAFGAARVMATCGTMGEAAGTAAALCVQRGVTPRALGRDHLPELRRTLLRQDASVLGAWNDDPDDLARRARVTASSTLERLAAEPGPASAPWPLTRDVGIVVPVSPGLDGVQLLVRASAATTLAVEAWSTGKPQNVVPVQLEAKADVAVAPTDEPAWVTVPLTWTADAPDPVTEVQNVILVVRADPAVELVTTALPPGVLALVHGTDADDQNVQVSDAELLVQWPTKPLRGRTVCFRLGAPTAAYAPRLAVEGYQRPYSGPNMWASGPLAAEPDGEAWLRLDWDAPTTVREVAVVLDDDVDLELNTLHHHRSPDEVLPQLVADYRVEVQDDDGSWRTVARERANRRRRQVHRWEPVATRALRLVVEATNGVPEARVVSLRAG